MSTRTNINLDSNSATKLRELAQLNIDSRDGFDYAAERIDDDAPAVAAKFRQWSDERARFAEQLDGILRGAGEEAQEDGSWAASMHRTWMNVRDMLSEKPDIYAIVAEAERGEDVIKQAYADAAQELSGNLLAVINEQYAQVKQAHDAVRDRSKCRRPSHRLPRPSQLLWLRHHQQAPKAARPNHPRLPLK